MEQITSFTSSISVERPIVVVDGMNNFIRHYLVNETMNSSGDLFGGAIGFLRTIKYLVKTFCPSKVMVVWEQGGASARRKAIYPEYKANREKQKDFNGLYKNDRDALLDDKENKQKQLLFLTKVLGTLPVAQVYVPGCEGDDVVAYIIKQKLRNEPCPKVVVSSDKDFYQLLEDPTVRIFNPMKKQLITGEDVLANPEFGVAPRNFCLARSIIGDESDNIPGVTGFGFKTVAKRFPFLADTEKDYNADDVITYTTNLITEQKKLPKAYLSLKENEEIIKRNWKLMYLDTGCFSASQIEKINYRIDNCKLVCNHLDFLKQFSSQGLSISQDLITITQDLKVLVFQQ